MKNNLFSIIIPVYNGASSIERLADKLIAEIAQIYPIEIILVNDYSKDNSKEICIDLYRKYPQYIRFFSLAKNVGEHNAVMCGLNQSKGDFAVIIDDDFQNPVSEVLKVIDYARTNDYDVIYTYYEKKHHHFFRNLGSLFNDKVANIMLKKPKSLYLSSFKALNRFLINEIIKYNLPFPYIDGLILQTTSNIGQLKVQHNKREQGKSNYTLLKLIALWLNMFINFSILPLRLSVFLGFIIAILSFLYGIIIIVEYYFNPLIPLGYSSLVALITFLSGVQLISIGFIGEYLGRSFLSQNKKPQFSIRESHQKEL